MGNGFGVGWRQVGATFVLMAAVAMITSGYGILAVPLAAEFAPSRMVLMLTITMITLVSGLISPLLGTMMDRGSLRLMMLAGALLIVAGFVALSFATTFIQVLVIYALLLAPANVLAGPMAAAVLLPRWFVKRRGTAMGIAFAGLSLGTFLYPPLTQLLLDTAEWRTAVRILALIVFVLTVPAALLIVDRPAARGLHADGAEHDPEQAAPPADAPKVSARTFLSDPSFWLLAVVIGVILAGMVGTVTNIVPLARDQGIASGSAALLISIYAAGGFISKLCFAAFADRVNQRYLLFALIVGYAVGMACMIGPEPGYWLIAGAAALTGFCGGIVVPMQSLLIPRIFGPHVVGKVSGLLNLVVISALLGVAPLFGLIHDMTGSYSLIFTIFVGLAVGTLLLVPYIRLHPRGAEPGRGVAPELVPITRRFP